MKIVKVLYLINVLPSISFSAQPPLPPKPPALVKAAAVDRIILPSPWEPTPPMLVHFESKTKNGTKTIYNGVLKTNSHGGKLTCKVIYDSQNNNYSGEVFNERFSIAEWHSCGLDVEEARKYYLNMVEQDPDLKRRLG